MRCHDGTAEQGLNISRTEAWPPQVGVCSCGLLFFFAFLFAPASGPPAQYPAQQTSPTGFAAQLQTHKVLWRSLAQRVFVK